MERKGVSLWSYRAIDVEAVCRLLFVDTRNNARLERLAKDQVQAFGCYLRGYVDREAERLPAQCLRPRE